MRPGAVERWRVLNAQRRRPWLQAASWCSKASSCSRIGSSGACCPAKRQGAPQRFEPATRQDVADADAPAVPALVRRHHARRGRERPRAAHDSRSVASRTPARANPLDRQPAAGEDPTRAMLKNVEDCYRDGDSLRNLVRPAERGVPDERQSDRRLLQGAASTPPARCYTVFAQELPLPPTTSSSACSVGLAAGRSGFSNGNPAAVRRRRRLRQGRGRRRAGRRLRRDEPARQAAAGAAVSAAG